MYIDNSRFLGIEHAHTLHNPVSHMDLLIWQNINSLGESANIIAKTIKLRNFNITVDGFTMFHYFATNSEVVEIIHDVYSKLKDKCTFETEMDYYLPI